MTTIQIIILGGLALAWGFSLGSAYYLGKLVAFGQAREMADKAVDQAIIRLKTRGPQSQH